MPFSQTILALLETLIDTVQKETGFPVLFMDNACKIQAAGDISLKGRFHPCVDEIMKCSEDRYVSAAQPDLPEPFSRGGCVYPLVYEEEKIGSITILGSPDAVAPVAGVCARMIHARLESLGYQENLQALEKKYHEVINNFRDVYFETTLDGQVKMLSDAAGTHTGYPIAEIMREGATIPYHDPSDRAALFQAVEKNGRVKGFEIKFRKKDGSVYDVSVTATAVRDTEGKISGLKGTIRDITERKKAEQQLLKSEEKFRLIFEHAPLGIFHFDSDGVITACNDNFLKIMGSSRKRLIGLKTFELPDRNVVRALEKALSGEVAFFQGDYKSVTSGKVTPVRVIFSPVFPAAGQPEGGMGIVEDITDRKLAENKLVESERRFRELAELLPETVYEVDLTGCLTFVNQKGFELFGYSRKEFEKGINAMDLVAEKDLERAVENVEKIINGESVGIKEYEIRRKDGSTFPALFHSAAIYQDGHVIGLRGFLIDMTEKKRTQELLLQSEKMMSIGGLAAGMAHEINNPLAGITQNAQVVINRLTQKIPANEKAAREAGTSLAAVGAYMEKRGIIDQLHHINNAGLRAARIVSNMLSFARSGSAEKNLYDLMDLVDKTLELLRADYNLKNEHDFKNVQIIKSFDPELPMVSCEKSKIQQVLVNIIKNSMDAAGEKFQRSHDIILKIKLSREMNTVRIEIEDNGPGIDHKTKKRIFEPFFTTKNVDKGTGLGLSLSYFIIVEEHGGEMEVESSPGKGAKFIIRLPVSSSIAGGYSATAKAEPNP